MTPALTTHDTRMGYQNPSPWNLRSSSTNPKLSSGNNNPALGMLWYEPRDDDDETSSFASSTLMSFDEIGGASNHPEISLDKEHPTKKKKEVHFDSVVKIEYIERVSSDDPKNLWYSPLEMILLKKECIFTLWCLPAEDVSLSDPSATDSDRYCIRGLETQRLRGRRAEVRRESLYVVLQEQECCRQEQRNLSKQGNDDCIEYDGDNNHDFVPPLLNQEVIAEKYAKISDPAKQAALLQGFEDEQVVKMMPYAHPSSRHHRYLFRFL